MAESFLAPLSLLATIIKTAPDALVVVDARGRIMYANEQTERLFGYQREDLMGEPAVVLLPAHCVDGGQLSPVEGEQLHHLPSEDGRSIPVEIRTSSVPFEGGSLVAYSIRDVTKRERAEREARRLREQIAHVSRVSAMGELVTSVAHEINQPLAAILSNAQAAQRFLDREDPDLGEVSHALVDIVAEDRRASEVITQLRSMVRRELRDPEQLDLGCLLGDLEPLLRKDAAERGIELTLRVGAEMPLIEGNPIQLQQVLLNLVLNAFDAVVLRGREDGAVGVSVADSGGGTVAVEVRDNGVGLKAGDTERIFEAFVTSKKEGLGMGLSIAHTVIETHGGEIQAENNDEGGATFRITLPVTS